MTIAFKKLHTHGTGHHLLLPIIVILLVAGIGGYIMQRGSSASVLCRNRTFSIGARSECVRDAQYMLGISADAAFGPNTQRAVKAYTGGTSLRPPGWDKLCRNKSGKYRDHACLGKRIGTPTYGFRVCTRVAYTSPGKTSSGAPMKPVKPHCASYKLYRGVGSKARADQALAVLKRSSAYKSIMAQYHADQVRYDRYYPTYRIQPAPNFTTQTINFGRDSR